MIFYDQKLKSEVKNLQGAGGRIRRYSNVAIYCFFHISQLLGLKDYDQRVISVKTTPVIHFFFFYNLYLEYFFIYLYFSTQYQGTKFYQLKLRCISAYITLNHLVAQMILHMFYENINLGCLDKKKKFLIKYFHCPLNTYYPINAHRHNILRYFKALLSFKKSPKTPKQPTLKQNPTKPSPPYCIIPATSKANNPIFTTSATFSKQGLQDSSLFLLTLLKGPKAFIHATEKLTISWLTEDSAKIEDNVWLSSLLTLTSFASSVSPLHLSQTHILDSRAPVVHIRSVLYGQYSILSIQNHTLCHFIHTHTDTLILYVLRWLYKCT